MAAPSLTCARMDRIKSGIAFVESRGPCALALAALVGCTPAASSESPRIPPPRPAPVPAAPVPPPRVEPPPHEPAASPESCLPPLLASEGRVVAAELLSDGQIAFCVRKGYGTDAPSACLAFDPVSGQFRGHDDLWPGFRTGQAPREDNPGRATMAGSAGTLTVCASAEDCLVRRVRAPARDAWDEVYGLLPAFTVPGTRRVLVADVVEGVGSGDRPPPATLFVDVYDLAKRARVRRVKATSGEYGVDWWPLGASALLASCEREGASCHAFSVDPETLRVAPLGVELDPVTRGGAGEPAAPVSRADDGSSLVVDARGAALLVFDDQGRRKQRIALTRPGDLSAGPSRAVTLSGGRVAVIQSAPNAGTVELVSLQGGITVYVPSACVPRGGEPAPADPRKPAFTGT